MKRLKFLNLVFVFLLASVYSIGQLTLGEATLSYVKAKALLRSESLSTALRGVSGVRYLGRVGGVAFDKVAMPAEGLTISSLQLNYSSFREDGKRFTVTLNGNEVQADIYDWELVPIAKYANSIHTACFTLFGDLDDDSRAQSIRENGGRILNYHPEFVNTLLGLRLFQLDILIVEPTISIDLPKEANRYLLGKGERSPDILSNRLGYYGFQSAFKKSNQDYRSYLICDQKRTIKFGAQNNSLFITGEPFYYFWKYNTDQTSFRNSIVAEIERKSILAVKQATSGSQKNILLENWLLEEIKREFTTLYGDISTSEYNEMIRELKSFKTILGQPGYIKKLKSMLSELKIENSPKEIVYLNNLSTTLSGQSQLFRNINPAVWNAAVKTMRYSAFFRYSKANFPDQWKNFIAQIKRIHITPEITTPTVLKME